jgi:hypothetical protein
VQEYPETRRGIAHFDRSVRDSDCGLYPILGLGKGRQRLDRNAQYCLWFALQAHRGYHHLNVDCHSQACSLTRYGRHGEFVCAVCRSTPGRLRSPDRPVPGKSHPLFLRVGATPEVGHRGFRAVCAPSRIVFFTSCHRVVICAGFASSPIPSWLRAVCSFLAPVCFLVTPPPTAVKLLLVGADPPTGMVAAVQSAISSVKANVLIARLRSVLACDVRLALSRVTVPMLFVQPRQDRLVDGTMLEEMRRIKPSAVVEAIDGPHLLLQRETKTISGNCR